MSLSESEISFKIYKLVSETVCLAMFRKVVVTKKESYYVSPELFYKINVTLNINFGIKEKLSEIVQNERIERIHTIFN